MPIMGRIEFETIRQETIKPSSPTPRHLRTHPLSFLDQLAPSIYVPIVLFYDCIDLDDVDASSVALKNSLAQTLTQFYPLAGKLVSGNSFVDCNDDGVEYSHVRVSGNLQQFVEKPDMKAMHGFLPFEPSGRTACRGALLAVQFNVFDCGGTALGVCVSHKIADGTSLSNFIVSWAAATATVAKPKLISKPPIFDSAIHFPPRDRVPGNIQSTGINVTDKIVTRRLVFGKSQVDELRARSSWSSSVVATQVEAVSAFLWARFMSLPRLRAKSCVALHAVNLRQRMVPELPEQAMGNLWQVAVVPTPQGVARDCCWKDYGILATELRDAIKGIDSDYIDKVQDGSGRLLDRVKKKRAEFLKGEIEFLSFSSWCRFPLYKADFGWGRPRWACVPTLPFKNVVVLMSSRDGGGVEALVNLLEDDMTVFIRDPEILPYVYANN